MEIKKDATRLKEIIDRVIETGLPYEFTETFELSNEIIDFKFCSMNLNPATGRSELHPPSKPIDYSYEY